MKILTHNLRRSIVIIQQKNLKIYWIYQTFLRAKIRIKIQLFINLKKRLKQQKITFNQKMNKKQMMKTSVQIASQNFMTFFMLFIKMRNRQVYNNLQFIQTKFVLWQKSVLANKLFSNFYTMQKESQSLIYHQYFTQISTFGLLFLIES
ncbi:hypothetical protein TTHERM_000058379 (macronuclear) [Tetrahymena thermophila SB210]|uniref:Uncharacterized protein n=1 Tax=Tetrahymena thermophila (strain SB210) TaxID=312017 RepID=W7XKG4_TETTS|nr:hypothetical protein TTHERM_000058379 [Tetrahymena thermophila SB210]EWS76506.1 hypothetical protein TTHERM_000058379 [Tetrahymena thermophila SB210]|eukprot:XP_012650959.1 hypothetical protein TTHERM_000058379 [Tetrahymena thermophila SB210]